MKSLVITMDQMSLNIWGCYGNFDEWTPQLDSFSTYSFVFDQAMAAEIGQERGGNGWADLECSRETKTSMNNAGWLESLHSRKIPTIYLGEKDSIVSEWASTCFENFELFSGEKGRSAQISATSISQLTKQACSQLEGLAELKKNNWFLLLGLEGVKKPWIVPDEWLELIGESLEFEAEDEPAKESGIDISEYLEQLFDQFQKEKQSIGKEDRELLLQLYSAYCSMIDYHIGIVLKKVQEKFDDEVLIIITAAKGDPFFIESSLAEKNHDRFQSGFAEVVFKIPLVIQLPSGISKVPAVESEKFHTGRSRELVLSTDFVPTILDWFEISNSKDCEGQSLLPVIRNGDSLNRKYCKVQGDHGFAALRSPDYIFYWKKNEIESGDVSETIPDRAWEQYEMYTRPEDLNDVNNIVTQVPDIAEEYLEIINSPDIPE